MTTDTLAELIARRAEDDTPGPVVGDEKWTWREVVAEFGRTETIGRP